MWFCISANSSWKCQLLHILVSPWYCQVFKAKVFPVVMYGCESWTVKKAECWRIDVLNCGVGEDSWETLELQRDPTSPSKGDHSCVFIGRTVVEAETPVLWPHDAKSWLIGKDRDAGKDWRQEEKGMTVGEIVGWHHWLNGHESEWTLGVGDGQGGLNWTESPIPK